MAASAQARGRAEPLSNGMLGFILFMASEVMFFGGLFSTYFIVRADSPSWPPAELLSPDKVAAGVRLELETTLPAIATCILVTSSFTMQWAVFQIRRGDRSRLIWGLFMTILLGLVFLTIQLYDYSQLPFRADDTVFGTTFFTLTGFHGAHVTGGVVFIAVCLARAMGGQFTGGHHEAVEAASMYWHFVDVVWIALFTILYLVPT